MPEVAAAKVPRRASTPDQEPPDLEARLAIGRQGRPHAALMEASRRYGGDLDAELAAIEEGTHPLQVDEARRRRAAGCPT
jgi:hypothetical protein